MEWEFHRASKLQVELTANFGFFYLNWDQFNVGDEFIMFWLKFRVGIGILFFWTWTLPKIQIFQLKFEPARNLSIKTARLFEFHETFLGRVWHCAKWRGVVSASLLRGSCVVDYYWSNTESPATLWWMQFFAAANFSKMSGRRTKVFSKRLKKVKRW